MVYSSMNTDNTDFSFFNIETAINGFVVKDDAAVAEVRLENELLIIIWLKEINIYKYIYNHFFL